MASYTNINDMQEEFYGASSHKYTSYGSLGQDPNVNDEERSLAINGLQNDISGVTNGSGDDPDTPQSIQQWLNNFFETNKGSLSEYQLMTVMYMMNQYGGATVQVQANNENEMNKYISELQQAWNILYSADSPAASGSTGANGMTAQFLQKLANIIQQIQHDPFFSNNPQGPEMRASIVGAIENVEGVVNSFPYTGNQLFELWAQYNPSLTGGTGQGDTTNMDAMTRQLGQLNQQFTGASQIVQAITQVAVKSYQAEQDALNNDMKYLNKLNQAIINAMQGS